ncbi:MAG: hypothetical protein JO224_11155 [Pelomonas sp.]|nr:hypothetical protein [Roseateles sp.]
MARKPLDTAVLPDLHAEAAEGIRLPEHDALGAWDQAEALRERDAERARSETLENEALRHAQCDDAAKACWYMARSLGAARELDANGAPTLELLFDLIGALADLPSEVCTAPLPEVAGGDAYGITELCQQLAMARELSEDAWVDAELATPRNTLAH